MCDKLAREGSQIQGLSQTLWAEALSLKVPTTYLYLNYTSMAALLKFSLLPHF